MDCIVHLLYHTGLSLGTCKCSHIHPQFQAIQLIERLPVLMISDNGKAIKVAAKVIQDVISSPEVQRYFDDGIGTTWRFNVPKAPLVGRTIREARDTNQTLS